MGKIYYHSGQLEARLHRLAAAARKSLGRGRSAQSWESEGGGPRSRASAGASRNMAADVAPRCCGRYRETQDGPWCPCTGDQESSTASVKGMTFSPTAAIRPYPS